jgi:DNA topoisomerase-1
MPSPRRAGAPHPSSVTPPTPEIAAAAKSAGLRYVSDETSGITREKQGKDFRYRTQDGRLVKDAATLKRIRSLAIPPAYTDVWICPLGNGHIQATGRDARRRKQYRYHPEWRAVRDENKYERTMAFARALPHIRRQIKRDLARPGLGREKVLAAITRLLETTLIRVGNEEYARENRSFGLTTMRNRHVSVKRGTIHFDFRGKSGKHHEIDLHDTRLAEIVRRAQDLPGQELFQYTDENGEPQKVSSEDVNAYLRGIAGEEFSAKDFRTWAGTVLAAVALSEFETFDSKAQAKKNLLSAIESVSERLGNTPSICRKCYIHPLVINSYLDGVTLGVLQKKTEQALRTELSKLNSTESAVLAFLQQRLRALSKKGNLTTQLKKSLKQTRRKPIRRAA